MLFSDERLKCAHTGLDDEYTCSDPFLVIRYKIRVIGHLGPDSKKSRMRKKVWDRLKVTRLRFLRQCKQYTSADPFLVIRKPETELFTRSFKAIRARIKKKSGIA